jgi:hypothetical protein
MKYLVIWEQDYDISWVNDIIEEDALDDYIEYFQRKFEEQEIKYNRNKPVIDVKNSWNEKTNTGEVNYLIDHGQFGKSWSLGFNYSLKEILSKEDLKNK